MIVLKNTQYIFTIFNRKRLLATYLQITNTYLQFHLPFQFNIILYSKKNFFGKMHVTNLSFNLILSMQHLLQKYDVFRNCSRIFFFNELSRSYQEKNTKTHPQYQLRIETK